MRDNKMCEKNNGKARVLANYGVKQCLVSIIENVFIRLLPL